MPLNFLSKNIRRPLMFLLIYPFGESQKCLKFSLCRWCTCLEFIPTSFLIFVPPINETFLPWHLIGQFLYVLLHLLTMLILLNCLWWFYICFSWVFPTLIPLQTVVVLHSPWSFQFLYLKLFLPHLVLSVQLETTVDQQTALPCPDFNENALLFVSSMILTG